MFCLLLLGRNLMPDDCAHIRNNVGFVLNDSQRRTLEQTHRNCSLSGHWLAAVVTCRYSTSSLASYKERLVGDQATELDCQGIEEEGNETYGCHGTTMKFWYRQHPRFMKFTLALWDKWKNLRKCTYTSKGTARCQVTSYKRDDCEC